MPEALPRLSRGVSVLSLAVGARERRKGLFTCGRFKGTEAESETKSSQN